MDRLFEADASLSELLPRLLFLEPALAGKRVLVVQCGEGDVVQFLAEMDTARVVGVDLDAEAIARGRKQLKGRKVDLRAHSEGRIPADDGAFDVIVDFSLSRRMGGAEAWRVPEYARILAGHGFLITSVPNAEGLSPASLVVDEDAPVEASYETMVAALQESFPEVGVYGQSPLLGFSFTAFNTDPDDAAVGLDTALMGDRPETVAHYLMLAGVNLPDVNELTLVQLPFAELAASLREKMEGLRRHNTSVESKVQKELQRVNKLLEERDRALNSVADKLPKLRQEINQQAEAAEKSRVFQQELTAKIDVLTAEVLDRDTQIASLHGAVQKARAESDAEAGSRREKDLAAHRTELRELQEQLKILNGELELARLSQSMADEKVAQLTSELSDARGRLLGAEAQRSELRAEVEQARASLALLTAQARRSDEDLAQARTMLAVAQSQVEDLGERIARAARESGDAHQLVRDTQLELTLARAELKNQGIAREETTNELREVRARLLDAERNVGAQRQRVVEMDTLLGQLTVDRASLLQQVDQLTTALQNAAPSDELEAARAALQVLHARIAEAEATRDDAQRALVGVVEQRYTAELMAKQADERAAALLEQLEIATVQVQNAEREKDSAVERQAALIAEREAALTMAEGMEAKLKTLRETVAERGREAGALRDQLNAKEMELAAIMQSMRDSQAHFDDASTTRQALEAEVSRLRAEFRSRESAVAMLEEDMARRATNLDEAAKKITELEASVARLQASLDEEQAAHTRTRADLDAATALAEESDSARAKAVEEATGLRNERDQALAAVMGLDEQQRTLQATIKRMQQDATAEASTRESSQAAELARAKEQFTQLEAKLVEVLASLSAEEAARKKVAAELEDARAEHFKALEDAREREASLVAELDALKARQDADATTRNAHRDDELKDLRRRETELTEQVAALLLTQTTDRAARDRADEDLRLAKHDVDLLTEKVTDLAESLRMEEQAAGRLRGDVENLTREADEARNALERARTGQALAEAENIKLQSELEAAEQRLNEAADLNPRLDTALVEKARLQSDVDTLKNTVASLEERLADATRETFMAREQRGRGENETGRVRARLAEVERLLEDATVAKAEAEVRLRDVESILGEDVKAAQATVVELANALEKASEEAEHGRTAIARVSELEAELAARRADLEEARFSVEKLQNELATVNEAVSHLGDAQLRAVSTEKELATLRTQLEQTTDAADEIRASVDKLETELAEVRKERASLEEQAENSRAMLDVASDEARRLTGEVSSLRGERDRLQSQLDTLNSEVMQKSVELEAATERQRDVEKSSAEARAALEKRVGELEETARQEAEARAQEARQAAQRAGAVQERLALAKADADEMRERATKAEEKLAEVQTRLADKEATVERLLSDLAAAANQHGDVVSETRGLQAELNGLNEQLKIRNEEIEKLRMRMEDAAQGVALLEQDLQTARAESDARGVELERVQAEVSHLKSEHQGAASDLHDEMTMLQQSLDSMRAENKDLQARLDATLEGAHSQSSDLQARLDATLESARQEAMASQARKVEIDHLRGVMEELQDVAARKDASLAHAQSVLEEAQEVARARAAELDLVRSVLEEAQQNAQVAHSDADLLRSVLDEVRDALQLSRQAEDAHHAAESRHKDILTKLRVRMADSEARARDAEARAGRLESQVTTSESRLAEVERELNAARVAMNNLQSGNDSDNVRLQMEVQMGQQQVADLDGKLQELQTQHRALEEALQDWQQQYADEHAKERALRNELDELSQANRALQTEMETLRPLRAQLQTAESQLAELHQLKDAAQLSEVQTRELEHLRDQLASSQAETAQVQQRIAELQAQYASLEETHNNEISQMARELEEHIGQAQRDLETLRSEHANASTNTGRLSEELEALRNDAENARAQLNDALAKSAQMLQRNAELSETVEQLRMDVRARDAEMENLRNQPAAANSGAPVDTSASMQALASELRDRDAQVVALREELKILRDTVSQLRVKLSFADGAAPGADAEQLAALKTRAESADQAWTEAADLRKEVERSRDTLATLTLELEELRAHAGQQPGAAVPAPVVTAGSEQVAALERQIGELKEKVERQAREIKDKTERISRLTSRLAENRP